MNIGLIGAGAIARQAYLPILKDFPGLKLTAVVEPEPKIAAELVNEFSLSYLGPDLEAALPHVEAVIICAPNHLHYGIARSCLEQGKHVVCEKPITTNVAHGETLLHLAAAGSLAFTVAHVRRFHPAVHKIKEIIDSGDLGVLKDFDFREGTVFGWPTVTGFTFDKDRAGGGVLMDIGVHLLDLLFWWIDDEISSFQYTDDTLGGVEATAEIEISFHSGISGYVKLTRLAVLRNLYTFRFEKGVLSWNPFTPRRIYISKGNGKMFSIKTEKGAPVRELLRDFSAAVQNKRLPFVTGSEALQTLKFIMACYSSRQAIPMSWLKGEDSL